MKQGRSLQELAAEIERQAKAKKDYLVDTRAMTMLNATNCMQLHVEHAGASVSELFGVNEVANSQIGTHLGIPAKYYDKMLNEHPDLLAMNVNEWFNRTPSTRMLRTLDGTARAFLSDRYRRIDNLEIAEAVLPIIGGIPDAKVESCELTDRKMYIKVVDPRTTAEVAVGDVVQAGVLISNSEVGLGSVTVHPLLYRLVCKNGMVAEDFGVKKYHVGRLNESMGDLSIFRNETIIADDKAFLMKLEDTVRAAVNQATFNRIVGKMREAKDAKIEPVDVPQVVELTSKEFRLNDGESQGVLGHLISGGDLSLFGLGSAVTRHAQDVESYDRSTELESVGYRIITMAPALWKRINSEVA